jgi:hypothetical protein
VSRARALPYVAVVALAAAFFAPELFGGRMAVTGNMAQWLPWAAAATPEARQAPSVSLDCNLSYYPRRDIMHRAWRDGVVPFWNPYSFCGTPFLGDIQSGVLYPPNWILLPLDPGTQMGWFLFLHCAWAGIGVMLLARAFGAPRDLALLAGCAWAMNGYFAKHFGQPTFLATAAWMPWVLLAAVRVARRADAPEIALLGLAGALTFLAGQPQLALFAAYSALAVAVPLWIGARGRSDTPRWARVIAAFLAAGALAVLTASAQLLPTRALAELSARADLPWASVVSGALHPVEWIRFLVPDFFGSPVTGDEWSTLFPRGDGFYLPNQMNSVFAGTPVLALALWAMFARRTRGAALPFTLLFAAAALVTFGSPAARLAFELLPGFGFARIDRAGSVVVLALIVPAAMGAADLATARGRGRKIFGAALILAAAAGLATVKLQGAGLPLLLGADPARLPDGGLDAARVARILQRTAVAGGFLAATGAAFLLPASRTAARLPLALACLQLFLFASPYRIDRKPEEVYPPSAELDRLRTLLDSGERDGGGRLMRFARDMPIQPSPLSAVLPPSTNVPYELRDLQGYNALADRKLGDALEAAWGEGVFSHGIWTGRRIVAPDREAALEHPLLDALSVRAAVSGRSFRAAGWVAQPSSAFVLQRNLDALPRVRLAAGGSGVSAERMEQLLRAGSFDPRGRVLWVGEGDAGADIAPTGTAWVAQDTWNELSVRTRTDAEAVLVVADSWSRGWTATVDGEPVGILAVYGLVRGVVVPAGDHVVRMLYVPPGLRLGTVLSLVGLALAGTALAVGRGR